MLSKNDQIFVIYLVELCSYIIPFPAMLKPREIRKFTKGSCEFHLVACCCNLWEEDDTFSSSTVKTVDQNPSSHHNSIFLPDHLCTFMASSIFPLHSAVN